MSTTRRLAASAIPMLLIAGAMRGAAAKSLGPAALEACRPGAPLAACAEAKTRLLIDGGDAAAAGLCPHCADLLRRKQRG